jgi:hypothetical protein
VEGDKAKINFVGEPEKKKLQVANWSGGIGVETGFTQYALIFLHTSSNTSSNCCLDNQRVIHTLLVQGDQMSL